MKKTSKLFGAIALSATLAMGCALPAFAAETAGATDDIEASEDDTTINKVEGEELTAGTKNTVVKVSTHTSQITVTVPIALPVVADTAGGFGLSPNNYGITNGSVPDIEVTGASWNIVDDAKAKWNLGSEEFAEIGGDPVLFTKDDDDQTEGSAPSMGTLFLALTPGAMAEDGTWTDTADAVSLNISSSTVGTSTKKQTFTQKGTQSDLGWIIKGSGKAATEEEQTQLLHVTTSSSIIAGEQESSDAIAITYTVKLA